MLREFPSPLMPSDYAKLTPRQTECVELYVEHTLTQSQVAAQLGITQQTVRVHLTTALSKMQGGISCKPITGMDLDNLDPGMIQAVA